MIALPIMISIIGDRLSWGGATGICRGCAASATTGANAELLKLMSFMSGSIWAWLNTLREADARRRRP